ncbi:MAG: EutP/PduV family microcompartment system protein [Shewanella sp.]
MTKKIMLIGQSECGKTSLIQALKHQPLEYKKTQMLDFSFSAIDTPGEYLESPRFYPALINTSYDADIIAFIQSADCHHSLFAPLFAKAFNRPVIGIITKTDTLNGSYPQYAKQQLINAGINEFFITSSYHGVGIKQLRQYLNWD